MAYKHSYQLFTDIPFKSYDGPPVILSNTTLKYMIGINTLAKLKDTSVDQTHCEIIHCAKRLLIHNLSIFGTYIKIKPNTPVEIPFENYFIAGKTWITISEESITQFKIEVIDKDYKLMMSASYDKGKVLTVGKAADDTIKVDFDDTISSHHAQIIVKDKIILTDYKDGKGSTNGTWVNFTSTEILEGTAKIRIGVSTFLNVECTKESQPPPVEEKLKIEFSETGIINEITEQFIKEQDDSTETVKITKDKTDQDIQSPGQSTASTESNDPIKYIMTQAKCIKDHAQIAYMATYNDKEKAIQVIVIENALTDMEIDKLSDIFEKGDYDEVTVKIVYAAQNKNKQGTKEFLASNKYKEFIQERNAIIE